MQQPIPRLLAAIGALLALVKSIPPLIGSTEAGPLGLPHLPRFWLKVRMKLAGVLEAGYPDVGNGFDTMHLAGYKEFKALGIDPNEIATAIRKEKLTYPQTEELVKKHLKNGGIHPNTLRAIERMLFGYEFEKKDRDGILTLCGIPVETPGLTTAVELNPLEDWEAISNWLNKIAEAIAEVEAAAAVVEAGERRIDEALRSSIEEPEVAPTGLGKVEDVTPAVAAVNEEATATIPENTGADTAAETRTSPAHDEPLHLAAPGSPTVVTGAEPEAKRTEETVPA
jgi:hypothetical protein